MKNVEVTFTCKDVPGILTETVEVPDTMTDEEVIGALNTRIKELYEQLGKERNPPLVVGRLLLVVQK